MPRLSDSMEQGTILTWLKSNGDQVEIGDELVEIETDKATMTYEAPLAGVLEILVQEGASVAVDTPIAQIGAGDSGRSESTEETSVAPPGRSTVTNGSPEREPALIRRTTSAHASPGVAQPVSNGNPASQVPATPLARRVAAEHGVDPTTITGTGPRGRVTRRDILTAIGLDQPSPIPARRDPNDIAHRPPPVPSPEAAAPSTPGKRGSTRELTRPQEVIALKMAQTKADVPDFQVQTEAAMDAVLALRGQLKAALDPAPSVNDFIVKAAALALREFPLVNGSYVQGSFELHDRINVGVAVAAEGALIVPTVTDADARSLGSIAAELRRLAAAVRDGTITPPELSSATFTVSNLGMYGMTAITPIINAPQAAILGVGATRPVLTRVDGQIIERALMTLTLSCDHRIIYGAEASQFLSRVRNLLEQPLQLAL